MSDEGAISGTIPFGSADERAGLAVQIAGVLAEFGVQCVTLAYPRVCRGRELLTRETDLPRHLMESAPGTTIAGAGVALLIDEACVRWVADADIARSLHALANPSSLDG